MAITDMDACMAILDHQNLVRDLRRAVWEEDTSLSTLWKIFSKPNSHMALASLIEDWDVDKLNILAGYIVDSLKGAIEDADPEMIKLLAETPKDK